MSSQLLRVFLWLLSVFGTHADNPDVFLPTVGIIRRHGYPAETHTVETKDGYLLGIHRIPHGKEVTPTTKARPAIYLQHGILSSSADWILTGPEKGLGFLLADRGYDVWIGNARGNTYSRQHTSLKPSNPEFWKFSWDQVAQYDLPAVIDHILRVTGHRTLTYVGHSMGTTVFFAMASSLPQYSEKVNLMVALAPVAMVNHMKCPLRLLAPWIHDLEVLEKLLGNGELLPQSKILEYLAKYLCDKGEVTEAVCANILFILAGYDKPQLNETILPVILSHTPAGTSSLTAIQFAQQFKSGRFSKFDFGEEENKKKYNSSQPPSYALENITTPIAIFYSNNDLFVSFQDLDNLTARLSNIVNKYEVPYKDFNHLDFIYATDAPTLLYGEVFRVLKKYGYRNESETIIKKNRKNKDSGMNHYNAILT